VNEPGPATQQTGVGFQAAAPANATASCRFGLYRNSTTTPVSTVTVNMKNGPGLFALVLAAVRFLSSLLGQFSFIEELLKNQYPRWNYVVGIVLPNKMG
jgi:hypothetical protein